MMITKQLSILLLLIGLVGPKLFAQLPQTEVWLLSVDRNESIKKKFRPFANRKNKTLENEYSPRLSQNSFVTTVRVEQDEVSQVLWEYPKNGKNKGSKLIDDYTNIGYYQPLSNFKMAMFVIDIIL